MRANALTASWAGAQPSENTAFSGVGCWVLLSLLAHGASGPARLELESAIGLPPERALASAVSLLALLRSLDPVDAALGIWARAVLDPEWVKGLPVGLVGQLTDEPGENQRLIDRWVDEATRGRLQESPIGVDDTTVLLLVSALTLETTWTHPFRETAVVWNGPAGQRVPGLVSSELDLDRLRVIQTEVGPLTLLQVPSDEAIDVHLVRGGPDADAGAVLAAGVDAVTGTTGAAGCELQDGATAPGVEVKTVRAVEPGDRHSRSRTRVLHRHR